MKKNHNSYHLVGCGGVAVGGAAGGSQTIQVSHNHHSRLPEVDGQVIILR